MKTCKCGHPWDKCIVNTPVMYMYVLRQELVLKFVSDCGVVKIVEFVPVYNLEFVYFVMRK